MFQPFLPPTNPPLCTNVLICLHFIPGYPLSHIHTPTHGYTHDTLCSSITKPNTCFIHPLPILTPNLSSPLLTCKASVKDLYDNIIVSYVIKNSTMSKVPLETSVTTNARQTISLPFFILWSFCLPFTSPNCFKHRSVQQSSKPNQHGWHIIPLRLSFLSNRWLQKNYFVHNKVHLRIW